VINKCILSLRNISPRILEDIAEKISDSVVDKIQERKDKFVS
jgi:hypothetical protein